MQKQVKGRVLRSVFIHDVQRPADGSRPMILSAAECCTSAENSAPPSIIPKNIVAEEVNPDDLPAFVLREEKSRNIVWLMSLWTGRARGDEAIMLGRDGELCDGAGCVHCEDVGTNCQRRFNVRPSSAVVLDLHSASSVEEVVKELRMDNGACCGSMTTRSKNGEILVAMSVVVLNGRIIQTAALRRSRRARRWRD